MGMDVMGASGSYFRRSVWGWRPLWDYCVETSEVARNVEYGHSNDGDGLNGRNAKKLARELQEAVSDGSAQQYIVERNAYLAELERPVCKWCEGTGIRTDAVGIESGWDKRELSPEMQILTGRTHGSCNACNGEGKTDAWETHYSLDIEDIIEFSEFLESCNGFEIW
jgi:hypothetical protein